MNTYPTPPHIVAILAFARYHYDPRNIDIDRAPYVVNVGIVGDPPEKRDWFVMIDKGEEKPDFDAARTMAEARMILGY